MNWLLIRGLGRECKHWGPFPKIFENTVSGSKTFCLDLPGMGGESHQKAPLSVNKMTVSLRQRWTQLKNENDGPWSILGLSLGGMVALNWCTQHDDFTNCVVINTSGRRAASPLHRLKGPALMKFARIGLSNKVVDKEKFILELISGKEKHDLSHVLANWINIANTTPASLNTLLAQLIAAARFRIPDQIHSQKLLVLASNKDQIVSPVCSEKIARLLSGSLIIHDEAGHDLPLDAPQWVCDQINKSLNPA